MNQSDSMSNGSNHSYVDPPYQHKLINAPRRENTDEATQSISNWYIVVLVCGAALVLMTVLFAIVTTRRKRRSKHSALVIEKEQSNHELSDGLSTGFFHTESPTTLQDKEYTVQFEEKTCRVQIEVPVDRRAGINKSLELGMQSVKPAAPQGNDNNNKDEPKKTEARADPAKEGRKARTESMLSSFGLNQKGEDATVGKGEGTVVSMCDRDLTLATQTQENSRIIQALEEQQQPIAISH